MVKFLEEYTQERTGEEDQLVLIQVRLLATIMKCGAKTFEGVGVLWN